MTPALIIFGGLITVIVLSAWLKPGRKKPIRAVSAPPQADVDRLGEALAAWQHQTKELAARLESLEDHARKMLAEEHARLGEPRNLARQIQDANFLNDLRPAREAGAAWLEAARALSATEQRVLADAEIDPTSLASHFELSWGVWGEYDKKQDRRDEIEPILASTTEALAALNRIDQVLTTLRPGPYR